MVAEKNVVKNTSIKQIIVVDVDDVISDYASSVVRFARREYDKNFTRDDVLENWGNMFNLSQDEWACQYKKFLIEENFYENPPVIEGAVETLRRLRVKFDLVILTSRPMFMRDATLKFLDSNFPNLFKEVLFANIWDAYDDEGVDLHTLSHITKAEICRDIGASYLIDDQPKHCNGAAEFGVQCLLFGDYGWNRNAKIESLVTRVANWTEVEKYFGV